MKSSRMPTVRLRGSLWWVEGSYGCRVAVFEFRLQIFAAGQLQKVAGFELLQPHQDPDGIMSELPTMCRRLGVCSAPPSLPAGTLQEAAESVSTALD